MIKKNISIYFLFISVFGLGVGNNFVNAQSTQINNKYSYAEVRFVATNEGVTTNIDFGKEYIISIDQKEEITQKVNSFKNAIDIINYLSDMGWEYIDRQFVFEVIPVINYRPVITHNIFYTFRKQKTN